MALPCLYACMQYACDAVSICVNGISVIRSRTFEEYTFQHSMSLLKIYFFLIQEQQQQQPLSTLSELKTNFDLKPRLNIDIYKQ